MLKKITSTEDLQPIDKWLNGDVGVIELAVPVVNILEWKDVSPNYYGALLGLTPKEIEKIVYYITPVVVESVTDRFSPGQILMTEAIPSDEEVTLAWGAKALEFLLSRVYYGEILRDSKRQKDELMVMINDYWDKYDEQNMDEVRDDIWDRFHDSHIDIEDAKNERERMYAELIDKINSTQMQLYETRMKLDAARRIKKYGITKIAIHEIHLFPDATKTIIRQMIGDEPYRIYDLDFLYRRVVMRNERVKKLMTMDAPKIILNNEMRVLQECVDALIANGKRGYATSMYNAGDNKATSLLDLVQRDIVLI